VLCVCRYYDNVCTQSVHDEEFSVAPAQRAVGLRPARDFVSRTGADAEGTAVFKLGMECALLGYRDAPSEESTPIR
jgi:hypothetical protein